MDTKELIGMLTELILTRDALASHPGGNSDAPS